MLSKLRFSDQDVPERGDLLACQPRLRVEEEGSEPFESASEVLDMREMMIVAKLEGLEVLCCQLTLVHHRVGKVYVCIEILDDHAYEILSLNQISGEVLSCSLSCWVAALAHLLDQFHSNLQILQRKLPIGDIFKAATNICLLEAVIPGLDLFTEFLASHLRD